MKTSLIALATAGALGLAALGGVAVAQQGPGGGEGRGWGHHGGSGMGMMHGEGGWRGGQGERGERRWGRGNPEQRLQRAERMLQFGFDQFDRNLDGVIEWSEAKLVLERRFDRMDTNSDGAITRADVEARMPQGGPGGQGGQGPNAEQRQERRAEIMNRVVERFMGRFGKPADGRVTKDEFVAQFEPVFKAMNRTNDGRLTKPQVEEFFVFMRMLRG